MASVFEIIAEPNRRAILGLLVSAEQTVGDIERQLRMSQPAVSKHLRVLRDAGVVEATVDAQRRLYRLRPGPLQEVDAWLAPFRKAWSAHVDALERHLDRADPATVPITLPTPLPGTVQATLQATLQATVPAAAPAAVPATPRTLPSKPRPKTSPQRKARTKR